MSVPIVDVNANLSRWPTRRMPLDETKKLVAKFVEHGVVEAWVGSFDGLLHKDIAGVNSRLTEECRAVRNVRLVPYGSINPTLPSWEDDLRRCAEEHRMPGIRLHPNYHGYKLDDPLFAQLLKLATDMRLIVALAATMEDERMMHPLLHVPDVDLSPLGDTLAKVQNAKLVLINANRAIRGAGLQKLLKAAEVYLDIAMLEGLGGVSKFLAEVPVDRVLFGSHAPAFYFESSQIKLIESPLDDAQLRAIRSENARRLLPAA